MEKSLGNEIWKDVVGYEGLYQVSSHGKVRSLPRWIPTFKNRGFFTREKMLSPILDVCGYRVVGLSVNNIKKTKKVHRIVAEAFIENGSKKPHVNHINGVRSDNNLCNLEWVTVGENHKHSYEKLGRKKWLLGMPPEKVPASKKVLCENFGITFHSLKQAGEYFGYTKGAISRFCKGVRSERFGLSFKYI